MLKHCIIINNYGQKGFIGLSQCCLLEQDLDFIAYGY